MSLCTQIPDAGEEKQNYPMTIIELQPTSKLENFRVRRLYLSGSCSELFHAVPDVR